MLLPHSYKIFFVFIVAHARYRSECECGKSKHFHLFNFLPKKDMFFFAEPSDFRNETKTKSSSAFFKLWSNNENSSNIPASHFLVTWWKVRSQSQPWSKVYPHFIGKKSELGRRSLRRKLERIVTGVSNRMHQNEKYIYSQTRAAFNFVGHT